MTLSAATSPAVLLSETGAPAVANHEGDLRFVTVGIGEPGTMRGVSAVEARGPLGRGEITTGSWSSEISGDGRLTRMTLTGAPDGRFALRLEPADLGRIDLQFEQLDDRTRVVVSAERAQTAETIRRHDLLLVDLLRQAGFDSLQVDIRHDSGSRSADDGLTEHRSGDHDVIETSHDDSFEALSTATAPPLAVDATSLDLRL
ncbi:MAG: flagellar hook-length control protein FliK [Pseudomonadota bacterium]